MRYRKISSRCGPDKRTSDVRSVAIWPLVVGLDNAPFLWTAYCLPDQGEYPESVRSRLLPILKQSTVPICDPHHSERAHSRRGRMRGDDPATVGSPAAYRRWLHRLAFETRASSRSVSLRRAQFDSGPHTPITSGMMATGLTNGRLATSCTIAFSSNGTLCVQARTLPPIISIQSGFGSLTSQIFAEEPVWHITDDNRLRIEMRLHGTSRMGRDTVVDVESSLASALSGRQ